METARRSKVFGLFYGDRMLPTRAKITASDATEMTAQRMMPSTSGLRPTLRITSMESPPPIQDSAASPQRAATECRA